MIINNNNMNIQNFMQKFSKNISSAMCFFIGIISFVFTTLMIPIRLPDGYDVLLFLPFATTVLIFFLYMVMLKNKIKDNGASLVGLIIIITYFVRNVLATYILMVNNFGSVFRNYKYEHLISAVWIMIYETVVVFFYILFLIRRDCISENKPNKQKRLVIKNNNPSFWYYCILFVAVFICILCLCLSRELRSSYFSIFTDNFTSIKIETVVTSGGISKIAYTGGKFLINIVRYILPITFITILAKKKSVVRLFLCVLIACIQVFFMTDGNAFILFLVIAQVIYITELFPSYGKVLIISTFIVGIVGIGFVLENRFAHTFYATSVSSFMQSYFSGVTNYAAGMHMIEVNDYSKCKLLFEDIYSCIPFRNTIFAYEGTGFRLAEYYNQISNTKSQIVPMGVESMYYLGTIFAPVFPCLAIFISFKAYKRTRSENGLIIKAVYYLIFVLTVVSPVLYDMRIILQNFIQIFIFMLIIANFSRGITSMQIADDKEINKA